VIAITPKANTDGAMAIAPYRSYHEKTTVSSCFIVYDLVCKLERFWGVSDVCYNENKKKRS